MGTITYYVNSVEQLNQALIWAGKGGGADNGQADNHVIELAAGWTIPLTQELVAINMSNDGDTLTINGNGATLDGGNWTRGLFVYNGTVTINDLTIANTVATGGDGGSGVQGGGGGAGLGGGLFIAGTGNVNGSGHALTTGGNVTISNVHFVNDSATGGSGGQGVNANQLRFAPTNLPNWVGYGGGGGGMGGSGGNAGLDSTFSYTGAPGGGGGIGLNADGGDGGFANSWYPNPPNGEGGGSGIVVGAGRAATFYYTHEAGDGGGSAGAGGANGGGGGGGGYSGFSSESRAGGGGVQDDSTSAAPTNITGGGFGGGAGGGYNSDGTGGFGGGGAGGGSGGFGGGGSGGLGGGLGSGGSGGFGAGHGGTSGGPNGGGGGGLGAGGAIFVQQGGSLTIRGSTDETGSSVTAGQGRSGGENGDAYGSGIFIQGRNTLTFSPDSGQTQVISGVIADEAGSDPSFGSSSFNIGRLVVDGQGTLTLKGHNTFTGGVTINAGRLELADNTAAGVKAASPQNVGGYGSNAFITFGSGAGALQIDLGINPANVIKGINADDLIDLKDFGNVATTSFNNTTKVLTVSNGTTTRTLSFDPGVNYSGNVFRAASDGQGGVNIFMTSTPAANLLVDGDFQLIDLTSTGLGVHYEPTNGNYFHGSPYGWTGSGAAFGGQLATSNASPGFAGSKVLFLESGGTISQSFAAPAKYANYKVDLDLSSRLDVAAFTTVEVKIYAGTTLVADQTFDTTSAGLGNKGHYTVTTSDLAAAGLLGQQITVSVTNTGGKQVFVDNVVASGLNLQGGAAAGTAGNLLVDGNFEQVNVGDFGPGVTISAHGNYVNGLPTGWTSFIGSVGAQQPTYEVAPGMGASVVGVLNAFSSMSQTFAAPGLYNTYQFSLDLADRADGQAAPASGTIRIYAGNVLIGEQAYDTSTVGPGSAQHIVINTNALNSEPLFSQHLFRQNITVTVSNTSAGQLLFDNVLATGLNLLTQTAPTVVPISSQTLEATGANGAASTFATTATDFIEGSTPVVFKEGGNFVTSGQTFSLGTHTIIASATNSSGQTGTTSFQIVVRDTTAPTLNPINDITREAADAAGAAATFSASATDIVDASVAIAFTENGNVVTSGQIFSIGTHNITATATDDYGNQSTRAFNIVVQDTTAPTISTVDQVAEATAANGARVSLPASATDSVDGARAVTFTENGNAVASGQFFSIGTHTIVATATDAHGNTRLQDFTVTVRDTTTPTLTLANATAEATGADGAAVTFATTTPDPIDGVVPLTFTENGNTVTSGRIFSVGTHTIHATATDAHGNTGAGDFTVTVRDTTAPALGTQADIVEEAAHGDGATATFGVTATDLVDGAETVVYRDGANVVSSGDLFAIGTHTIVASATDAHGNTGTTTFTITIAPGAAPVIGAAPNLTVEATGADGAAATFNVTATDALDGAVAVTYTENGNLVASGDLFALGTHIITVSATDSYPLSSTKTFTIDVRDTTAPTLTPQGNITASASDDAGAAVTLTVTATDLVDGNRAVVFTENGTEVHSGDVFSVGTHTVTATSQDTHGNTSSETFKVFVLNTTTVASAQELSDAIRVVDEASQASGGNGTHYVITIAPNVTLTETADLWAVNLRGSDTLTINGNGAILDGNSEAGVANAHRGLFVYTGDVTINDLTIEHTVAKGGDGANGGGGALGAGGGLFVANDTANGMAPGHVTLNNVVLSDTQAIGGNGSPDPSGDYGGGGGMGGDAAGYSGGAGVLGASNNFGAGGDLNSWSYSTFGGGAFTWDGNSGYGGGGGGGVGYTAGFGGGIGYWDGSGGGGLGAGGGIFVMEGAQLIINGGSLTGGHVAAGQNGSPDAANDTSLHYDAYAFGDSIFLQGNGSLTFAPAAGTTQTIANIIADEAGSGGSLSNQGYSTLNAEGHGSLIVDGAGTLALGAANTFTGGITINHGSLSLATATSAGNGAITLAQTAETTLTLTDDFSLANVIKGFDLNDTIDLEDFAATSVSLIADVNGVVTLTDASGATRTLKFDAAKSVPGFFSVTPDGHGGAILKLSAVEEFVAHNMDELNAFLRAMDAESLLTGGTGKHYVVKLAADATFLATTDIATINLHGGDTLTIDGQGRTVDGDGAHRGLFVYAGDVTVKDLTIKDMVARGGNGSGGIDPGGGGAGFGGSLFVANDVAGGGTASHVTLSNVHFEDGRAIGGNAGQYIQPQYWVNQSATRHGGAGGMGGNAVLSETPVWSNSGNYYYVNYYSTPGGGIAGSGVLGDGSFGNAATPGAFGTGSVNYAAGFGGGVQAQGGTGAGGNVFVQAGATLVIEGGGTSGGTAAGGIGLYSFYNGAAFGGGIYLQQSAGQAAPSLTLYATSANPTLTIADVIAFQSSSTGLAIGDATHANSGTVTLAAQNTYAGATTVNSGTLLVDGAIAGSAVIVKDGAMLGGHGTTGAVTVETGGTFAAGNSPGQLTVASLNLASGASFAEEIGGTTAGSGYDQTIVTGGAVVLNGATLSLSLYGGFAPHLTDVYRVIDNQGAGAINGTFVDAQGHALTEGAIFVLNGATLQISYVGGTGNDVTLTDVPVIALDPVNHAYGHDGRVNAAEAAQTTISGTTNETGGTVTLAVDGTIVATSIAINAQGHWSTTLDLSALGQGGHTLTAAIDGRGAYASATAAESFVLDSAAPAVTAVGLPADAIYPAGQDLVFTVTFGENVTVTGAPRIALALDTGGTVYADYVAGSGGDTLTFKYTVAEGVQDLTGVALGAAIDANAGAIKDAFGNDALVALNGTPSTAGIEVDGIAPRVIGVDVPHDGLYGAGENLDVVVHFNKAITVDTVGGTPYVELTLDNGGTVHAVYVGGSGSDALTFRYQVAVGDLDPTGITLGGAVVANGATLHDNVANTPVSMLVGVPTTAGVVVDGVAPTAVAIDTSGPSLSNATTQEFIVTFSEGVTGVDVGDFALSGNVAGTIASVAAIDGAAYRVTVTGVSGDGTLGLTLNGQNTGIRDLASNPIAAGLANGQTYTIDQTAPLAPSAPDLAAASDSGKLDTDDVTNVTTPTFSGTAEDGATVRLYDGAVLIGSAVAAGGSWSITASTLSDGDHTITTTATDAAGNVSTDATGLVVTIDTAPPAAPVIALAHDTGISGTDKLTGDPTITVAAANASYKVDGGSFSSAAPIFATDGSADGTHTVTVSDVDAAGNVSTSSFTFVLDTTAPVAQDGSATASVGETIHGHLAATDNLSTALSYSLVAQAAHGTVTLQNDGSFVYKSDPLFSGTDSFSFKANDGVLDSAVARMEFNITGVHLTGTPGDDSFAAPAGVAFIDALGGNDTVSFNFKLTDAQISFVGNQVIIDGPSSHTVVTGFEIYKFADGTVNNNGDPLVDDLFYYSQYHDVWNAHVDAGTHYRSNGWQEGRDPNALFDTKGYLATYADVKAAGVDPLDHYATFGWHEGRDPSVSFDTSDYLSHNPDVAAAHVNPLAHYLQYGQGEGRTAFADGVWG
jgi:autotransporter-associated beta strand protein